MNINFIRPVLLSWLLLTWMNNVKAQTDATLVKTFDVEGKNVVIDCNWCTIKELKDWDEKTIRIEMEIDWSKDELVKALIKAGRYTPEVSWNAEDYNINYKNLNYVITNFTDSKVLTVQVPKWTNVILNNWTQNIDVENTEVENKAVLGNIWLQTVN